MPNIEYNCYYPSPEDILIDQEELSSMLDKSKIKIDKLISVCFHRQELFDAWYAYYIESAPITSIAAAQQITWYQAKKRINTAQDIVISIRQSLHKL